MFGGKVKLGMKPHNDDVEDLQFGTLNLLSVERRVAVQMWRVRICGMWPSGSGRGSVALGGEPPFLGIWDTSDLEVEIDNGRVLSLFLILGAGDDCANLQVFNGEA